MFDSTFKPEMQKQTKLKVDIVTSKCKIVHKINKLRTQLKFRT